MTGKTPQHFGNRVAHDESRIWEIKVPCADGRKAFYKLAVHPMREPAFRKAWKEGRTVNLSSFGDIVEIGYIPADQMVPANEAN